LCHASIHRNIHVASSFPDSKPNRMAMVPTPEPADNKEVISAQGSFFNYF
jgi:hypothetical protein